MYSQLSGLFCQDNRVQTVPLGGLGASSEENKFPLSLMPRQETPWPWTVARENSHSNLTHCGLRHSGCLTWEAQEVGPLPLGTHREQSKDFQMGIRAYKP